MARTARNTVQVMLEGRGAQADLLGVVDGHGRQYVDFQTLQEHFGRCNAERPDHSQRAARSIQRQLYGADPHQQVCPPDRVEPGTEEHSAVRTLEGGFDPKLEILNNDVIRCTHGAAVGPVDQEMVFYLESRGLDQASAEQLIVEGFFQSTLRKLGHPRVEEALWSAIAEHESHANTTSE